MYKSWVLLVIAALLLQPLALLAQDPGSGSSTVRGVAIDPSYRSGASFFPGILNPYRPMKVPVPPMSNSDRVNQLLHDGALNLSLSDAIVLALENNLDIEIQRQNPKIADLDILRSKSGGSLRGVATSVTSASATGASANAGSQGGTGTSAGGVAQGSGGLVTSALGAGSSISSFDPFVTSTLSIGHNTSPVTSLINSALQGGVSISQTNTTQANFTYNQAFHSGTSFQMAFNNNRQTTNSLSLLSPQLNSNYRIQLTQHLMQGWGFVTNTRNIVIARNNREVSDLVFKQQIITTTTQVQNAYWDLVSALNDVKVKESSVAVAEKLYNDNKRQVEIGTLAPIEIVRAEAQVASSRQDLIVSQTVLRQQETLMKNLVLRNLNDPGIQAARVVPTDAITVPPVEPVIPMQELVATALSARPELAESRIDLRNREVSIKAVNNALLPTVDGFAYWGGTASSGVLNPALVQSGRVTPGTVPLALLGGLTNAWNQAFGGDFPTYAFGLSLTVPIRNRSAQADAAQAQIENNQATLRLHQLENSVRVEVQNALIGLQQNRARLDAAQKSRELQQQTLDAEQKKYQLGASTIYLVIQAQRDLAAAQSAEVAAANNYMKSRVELDRSTGQTILKNGISLEEAYKGQITHAPKAIPVNKQD